MATITGFTAERMLVIENETVIDGEVQGDNLHLIQRGGTVIDAGNVRGATGPPGTNGTNGVDGVQGPPGSDGLGVPIGGSVGQLLTKNSDIDNDSSWQPPYVDATLPKGIVMRAGAGSGVCQAPYVTMWTPPPFPVEAGRYYLVCFTGNFGQVTTAATSSTVDMRDWAAPEWRRTLHGGQIPLNTANIWSIAEVFQARAGQLTQQMLITGGVSPGELRLSSAYITVYDMGL
jgi:hypothetical protein